LVKRK